MLRAPQFESCRDMQIKIISECEWQSSKSQAIRSMHRLSSVSDRDTLIMKTITILAQLVQMMPLTYDLVMITNGLLLRTTNLAKSGK
ncbi:hypothetical protein AC579_3355 [Pseudocercospora musae]|uniref:Uncharacterized protein n=1 Tax=Pseudocercospora musae TaxID=113226 RepID=A0A139GSZ4_9PEZI|nr:hypothetical protein AC579_3355 [Pseudocercospora musae]